MKVVSNFLVTITKIILIVLIVLIAIVLAAFLLVVVLLIAFLRFGVRVEYSENGFYIWARIGLLSLQILPAKKEKIKKRKKVKKKKEPMIDLKPGNLEELLDMFPPIKNTLSRLKRKLLIKHLQIHYIAAGKDPSNTAMAFGTANVAISMLVPFLEEKFRIKDSDVRVSADFESDKQKIYVNITISIAVWEALYVAFALLPLLNLKKKLRTKGKIQTRKEVKENG